MTRWTSYETGCWAMAEQREHKPNPIRTQARCRVDCSCGWRGPLVSLPGHGYLPWERHFNEANQ